jgi:hypothetical protein
MMQGRHDPDAGVCKCIDCTMREGFAAEQEYTTGRVRELDARVGEVEAALRVQADRAFALECGVREIRRTFVWGKCGPQADEDKLRDFCDRLLESAGLEP